MKTFLEWFELRESNQDIASAYKNLLADVPQNPKHHPEGNVLQHVKLVRKAVPHAIEELKKLQQEHPQLKDILSDLNFNLTENEKEIVYLASWLHDIGKSTATRLKNGEIISYNHQDPEHYLPQIEKLSELASPRLVKLYEDNKELIHFLIEEHMSLMSGVLKNDLISKYFKYGKIVNDPWIKLLLILMWADKMGRTSVDVPKSLMKSIDALISSSEKSFKRDKNAENKNQPFLGDPGQFVKMLQGKGLDPNSIKMAVQRKFKLSDEDIEKLL